MSFFTRRSTTGLTGRDRGPSPNRRRTFSFKVRAEMPPPPRGPTLIQASYPVYRLKWEKLQAFLERRFPGHKFLERKVHGDRYVFEVPEALTSGDFVEIEKERDGPGPNEQVLPRRRRQPSPE